MKEVKLALPYKLNNDEMTDQTDEFNVLFNPNRNSIDKLYEFCKTFSDRRINIEYSDNNPKISDIRGLLSANPNVAVRVMKGNVKVLVDLIKEDIQAFFHYDFPAYNITSLSYMLSLGVSDVYLADDLFYNLYDVYPILQEKGVQHRMILNMIPSNLPNAGADPKAPIFPPECGHLLFPYVDVVEFECGRPFNWARCGVYYRAWFQREDWHGDLIEIIPNLTLSIPNDSLIVDRLIWFKLGCGRRCDARVTSPCNKCEQFIKMAQSLNKKGYIVQREKPKSSEVKLE